MSLYDDVVEVPRRTMVLFFLVDTSGSMYGTKIGTVNTAIEEIIPELKDLSENNADAEIKIATLAFSTGAKWINSQPISAENFKWDHLEAMGSTDLGEACKQLNEKLSKNAFMSEATGSFAPAIFLLSDGDPTDNYKYGLDKLKENNWYKKAIKVAIAIGDDVNKDVLEEFTGNKEAVITVHTPEILKKWIQFVSVRASEIGSKSASAGVGAVSKQEEFINEIKEEKEVFETAELTSFDDSDEW
ncbi:VWA domain-containing protein [Fusobacterium polymorphum]|jgi:uncharacterized protein encoded in toxicity protection region of plasmid R478, contains von willebrand factor (VWF) domain|uniref:VWFA domain-containing protein n=1 Tax=Fusobacterium nucleatum CTI-6 TaxID=1316587 RepID=U7TPY0_FUSNU|nr:VWA domain-containing protein [Fusobacterium nucleatum]ERT46458.1 hypothetical protein HMPREF1767_01916 [Fusobacterium nucleatum CTI-6]MBF1207038.1 VWA domain-containing protein [Fusobacterium periodonticum]MBF1207655.1 VWA domain-containing protein [Fusobacterium periodonticum]